MYTIFTFQVDPIIHLYAKRLRCHFIHDTTATWQSKQNRQAELLFRKLNYININTKLRYIYYSYRK